jgi:hypothetical protein
MSFNEAQIVADHASLKTLETTIAANFATLQGNLVSHADLCADMAAAGGNAGAEWHRIQVRNLALGYKAKTTQNNSPGGNPVQPLPQLTLFANDSTAARDTTLLDLRPVTAFDPSLT